MFSGKDLSGGQDGVDVETRAAAMQKEHYKTDWHRYNLKRKVADLPPVTAENFQERILANRTQAAEEGKDTSCRCDACGKFFSTANAYTNHLQSKKHKEMMATAVADGKKLGVSDAAQVKQMNEKNKQMSAVVSAGSTKNKDELNDELKRATQGAGSSHASSGRAEKMSKSHKVDEFFSEAHEEDDGEWEDVDDDDDEDDDDDYQVEALGVTHCLFCPQESASMEANITHMTVVHGFFIPDLEYVVDLEGLMAYLGEKVGAMRMCLWCNERSRLFTELRAVQQHMTDKGHCKVFHEGDAVLEYADFYDYRVDTSSEGDEEGAECERRVPGIGETELDDTGFQLVLPSGCTVGHRTLQMYFRQKLRPGRELVLHSNPSNITKVMTQYKSMGWLGTTGPAAVQKARDIAYANRMRSRYAMNVGVKANKLQRYFRDDNFGIKT